MYTVLLSLHNIFRWVVLAVALWASIKFLIGWLGKREFKSGDASARKIYPIVMDIQFTVGLILMFMSPFVEAFFDHPGGGMKNADVRFFGIEHWLVMLISLILVHIGAGKSKKAQTDFERFRIGALFFVPSLILMVGRIPWWRPMMRMFD